MHDRDVRLTGEEQRIIAAIERQERAQRSPRRRRWVRLSRWVAGGRRGWWWAVAVGTLLLGGGLVAGLPIVGLAGFVVVLQGTSRLCHRMKSASWVPRFLRWIGLSEAGQASEP